MLAGNNRILTMDEYSVVRGLGLLSLAPVVTLCGVAAGLTLTLHAEGVPFLVLAVGLMGMHRVIGKRAFRLE